MNTMMNIVSLRAGTVGIVLLGLLLSGCGGEKRMAPVAVGEMEEYRDPGFNYHIQHPKGWITNAQVGRARFYNALDVDKKFLDPTGPYPSGVEISIDVKKSGDPAAAIKQLKDDLAQGGQLGQEQPVKVGGLQGTKVPYKSNYGAKNLATGHHVLIAVDSLVYNIGFAGFGDHYNAYAAIFDACLNSFQPPKPAVKGRDATLPSETLSDYDAKLFTFQYPDNFNFTNPPKGNNELVLELRGVRQDCSIRFDVFGAKGLTVDKVFEQNKGKYKATSTGKATIGGQPALSLTYSPTKEVERRFFFVVKNDKVFRITVDWFKPQRDDYLTSYEKVISSINFK